MKKIITYVVAAVTILCIGLYIHDYRNLVRIDKNKIREIFYFTDIKYNKNSKETLMGQYNISKLVHQKDKNNIYHCLNDGKLMPDKNISSLKGLTKKITIYANTEVNIYMRKSGEFVAAYSLSSISNSDKDYRQTTFKSKVLKNYFIKWRKQIKKLKPFSTWNTEY